jgi:hypothetical protein
MFDSGRESYWLWCRSAAAGPWRVFLFDGIRDLTEFEIVIAVPRERESRPAPQAPVALQLSMPGQHRFKIGE